MFFKVLVEIKDTFDTKKSFVFFTYLIVVSKLYSVKYTN